jgi:hypothetical protein
VLRCLGSEGWRRRGSRLQVELGPGPGRGAAVPGKKLHANRGKCVFLCAPNLLRQVQRRATCALGASPSARGGPAPGRAGARRRAPLVSREEVVDAAHKRATNLARRRQSSNVR